MDLRFTEEQSMIRAAAREFLSRECPITRTDEAHHAMEPAGHCMQLWRAMAELGWQGLAIDERFGGSGLGFVELCLLLEEQGRVALASPFLTSTVQCGLAIAQAGSAAQQHALLGPLARGTRLISYAAVEPSSPWTPADAQLTATRQGERYRLQGCKLFVPYASAADRLLVVGRDTTTPEAGLCLLLVDTDTPGLRCTPFDTVGTEPQFRVDFDRVEVSATEALLAAGDDARVLVAQIEHWGTAARCAQMIGGAETVLDMTVAYAHERKAFGRPIGSQQAVQHHCANMASDVLTSRLVSYEAIWRLDRGLPAAMEVAVAKAWVSDAYRRVCALGQQIHGAIGFTGEHPMPRFSRHAAALEMAHGDSLWQREHIAQALAL